MREELEQLLELEWAGVLDDAGRARIEALVTADPALAARVREERRLSTMLRRCGPNQAPAGLSRAVLAQINSKSSPTGWRWPRLTPAFAYGFATAAILMAGALIVAQQRWTSRSSRLAQQIPARTEVSREVQLAKVLPEDAKLKREARDMSAERFDQQAAPQSKASAEEPEPALPEFRNSLADAVPAAPAADAVNKRAEPVPSPTPAPAASPAPEEPVKQEAAPSQAVAANNPRTLPEKMRPKLPEISENEGVVAAAAAPASEPPASARAAAHSPADASIEMEIQVAALASAPAAAPVYAAPAGPAKMRVQTQGFAAGAGSEPGAGDASAGGQAEATSPITAKDLEILLAGAGARDLTRTALDGTNGRGWRINATLTRGQLRELMNDLRRENIQPANAPGQAAAHYTIHAGQDQLDLGRDLKSAQQPVKLSLVVRE